MISIIVCSVEESRFIAFSDSVASTIGVPYEIVRIDNRQRKYSICSAYNEGIRRARFELLCFSHEDIVMNSASWGKVLSNTFADQTIGLVGVIGICFYNLFPFGWLDQNELEGQLNVGALPGKPKHVHVRFPSSHIAEVAGVDGMFMASRKKIFEKYSFPEKELTGFHGYDIDLVLHVRQGYRIVVSRDILLTHESGGVFNQSYHETLQILDKKWNGYFPIYINKYTSQELVGLKIKSLSQFVSGQLSLKERILRQVRCLRYARKHGILLAWLKLLLGPVPRHTGNSQLPGIARGIDESH